MTTAMCRCRDRGIDTGPGEPDRPLPAPTLSPREVQILVGWLVKGVSKGQLATGMYVSLGTVNTHLARIRAKYAAVGRPAPTKADLLVRALQDGLLTIDAFA